MAAMHTQIAKVLPQAPPVQLALYTGKLSDKLDIDLAANHLTNFLKSCNVEMQLAVQAMGKNAFKELNRQDLVTVDKDLAEFAGIRYAGSPRKVQELDTAQQAQEKQQLEPTMNDTRIQLQ